ncbi:putative BTB/POZ domain-containing protein [Septoria linicola]|nr:putative BTB/POZ domain-containing protein [Septoria linicola]
MVDLYDIAPEGDVTLVFGATEDAQTTRIRVSSVVLSLGSPVFKAMLGPHFKEGQILKTGSQLDLPLPDDDPEIMLLICEVMHMKRVTMNQPNPERLLRLAVVVDKYDCRVALAYFICTWFQQLPAFGSDFERVNVFFAAFYFKLPEEFARLGRQIVLENSGAIVSDDLTHCEPGLEYVLGEANSVNGTRVDH